MNSPWFLNSCATIYFVPMTMSFRNNLLAIDSKGLTSGEQTDGLETKALSHRFLLFLSVRKKINDRVGGLGLTKISIFQTTNMTGKFNNRTL